MEIKYFDNAATTKVKEEVLNEMLPYYSIQYGNPSSLYTIGRYTKRAIEKARKQVANLINCNSNEIYFTGSGTESDNTALKGIAYANKVKGNHIITSKIEHPAILNACKTLEKQGFKVSYINVDKDGIINIQELVNSITKDTILISVMFANNEIGTIEPIEKISAIAKKYNIIFHTDAVQAVGNVPIDVKSLGIDLLSLSGHKINGPKGVGALYVKTGINFDRIMDGGGQEKKKRSGTENVAGIVGLGKAAEISQKNMQKHINKLLDLREYFIKQIEEKNDNFEIKDDEIYVYKEFLEIYSNIKYIDVPIKLNNGNEVTKRYKIIGYFTIEGQDVSSNINEIVYDANEKEVHGRTSFIIKQPENLDFYKENTATIIYTKNVEKTLSLLDMYNVEYNAPILWKNMLNEEIKKTKIMESIIIIILYITLGINIKSIGSNTLERRKYEVGIQRTVGAKKK